jgi:hypothetical protein
MLISATGCSASSGPGEEESRAAKLIHGLEDKLKVGKGNDQLSVSQTSASPAIFNLEKESAIEPASTIIFTVTKLSKCKYQTDLEMVQGKHSMAARFTTDLAGLVTSGHEESQPQGGSPRELKGAVITCEVIKNTLPGPDENQCNQVGYGYGPGESFAIADISGPDLDALATKFKQDFCR